MNVFISFRNVIRHNKLIFLLNVMGMGVAVAAAYMMLVQVHYDFSYNSGIKHPERLFALQNRIMNSEIVSPIFAVPCARLMVSDNPLVEGYHLGHLSNRPVDHTFEKFPDEPLVLAGTELTEGSLKAMGVELVDGDFEPVLKRSAMAFSRSVAQKYNLQIGDRVCWGREYKAGNALTVGAIFKDFPSNSDLAGLQAFYGPYYNKMDNNVWSDWNDPLYVRLFDENDVEAFMQHFFARIQLFDENDRFKGINSVEDLKSVIRLVPFTETYFSDNLASELGKGNKITTYTMLSISLLILLIACINFFNFFVALVPRRMRSVNTQKILGASNASLRFSICFESFCLMLAACACSLLFLYMAENSALREFFSLSLFARDNIPVALCMLVLLLSAALGMALYPAIYLTSFTPAFVLKGSFGATRASMMLRNTLIGVQFVLSFVFIIVTLFMYLQNSYMKNYDVGFDKDCVLMCSMSQLMENYGGENSDNVLHAALESSPYVTGVSSSLNSLFGDYKMGWGRHFSKAPDGKNINFRVLPVSKGFLTTLGIDIIEGRDFAPDDATRSGGALIFNRKAKEQFNMSLDDWVGGTMRIVGFCENFNERGMQYPIEPFAFYYEPGAYSGYDKCVYVRFSGGDGVQPLVEEHMKKVSEQFGGTLHRNYGTHRLLLLNDYVPLQYRKEDRQLLLITFVSMLAIIMSLVGVFGLVFFETQYRQKEIAIRRVNGALISNILFMLNVRFVKILVICFAVAIPLGTYFALEWLQEFAYKTPLHWWAYLLAFAVVMTVTLLVVVLSAWRTVNKNPIDVIRME